MANPNVVIEYLALNVPIPAENIVLNLVVKMANLIWNTAEKLVKNMLKKLTIQFRFQNQLEGIVRSRYLRTS